MMIITFYYYHYYFKSKKPEDSFLDELRKAYIVTRESYVAQRRLEACGQ